jgi:hypothetical protein
VSNLINEILLRLLKLAFGGVLGAIVYVVAVGLLGVPASFEVAALSFLCGGMAILLVQESPL